MENVTALLEQVKIAESLAEHYESFGDIQSANDARNESVKLLQQARNISTDFDIDVIEICYE